MVFFKIPTRFGLSDSPVFFNGCRSTVFHLVMEDERKLQSFGFTENVKKVVIAIGGPLNYLFLTAMTSTGLIHHRLSKRTANADAENIKLLPFQIIN